VNAQRGAEAKVVRLIGFLAAEEAPQRAKHFGLLRVTHRHITAKLTCPGGGRAVNSGKPECRRGQVQRMDTHEGS
jgi:hypothetical protein